MLLLVQLISVLFGRSINLKPNSTFEMFEEVVDDKVFKLMYKLPENGSISLYSPSGKLAYSGNERFAHVFCNIPKREKSEKDDKNLPPLMVKIKIINNSDSEETFSYKMPDVFTELTGYVGYIEKEDSVTKLKKSLNELLTRQKNYLEIVQKSRNRAKSLSFCLKIAFVIEILSVIYALYFMHGKIITLIESKENK